MEIDKSSFYPLILDILTDISTAHFVAFDLELSGVPTKFANSKAAGRPSLQERYLEIKEAAERYQILQIGLTCVKQDVESNKYILQPYNFELSPLIEERGIDIERNFSFHSGAVDFLMKVNFDMTLPFYNGIPYLSRDESKLAREKFKQRNDKSNFADIQIKPTETETLAFMERVRGEINAWVKSKRMETLEYLNIGKHKMQPGNEDEEPANLEGLSRYEKRLVYQLVRNEYPDLVAIGKRDFIQIVRFDKQREDKILADKLKELNERLNRQKGFRWIIEALRGSQLVNLDLKEVAKDPVTGERITADLDDYKAQFHRAHTILRGNPRMMVGHNCFLDLVYLYRTFIGTLPDTVEEFQCKLHAIWPEIVDTKYMSTHECGDINPVSSLEQIATQLSEERVPIMEIDREHMKYASGEALHEAGYDSFLTAQVAIRLSSKLQREAAPPSSHTTTDEKNLNTSINNLTLKDCDNTSPNTLTPSSGTASPPSRTTDFIPSEIGGKWKHRGDPSLPAQDPEDLFQYRPADRKHRHHDSGVHKSFVGGMPIRRTEFWRVYGNKLRVFGTEEGVCDLSGGEGYRSGNEEVKGDGGVKVPVN